MLTLEWIRPFPQAARVFEPLSWTSQPALPLPVADILPAEAGRAPRDAIGVSIRICQAIAEVLAGRRPAWQLERWLSEAASARLGQLARTHPSQPWRLASHRVQSPTEGVIEAVARLSVPGGSRAVALRLESDGAQWRATRVELALGRAAERVQEARP